MLSAPAQTHLDATVQNAIQEVQQMALCLHSARWHEIAIVGQIHHDERRHRDLTDSEEQIQQQIQPEFGHLMPLKSSVSRVLAGRPIQTCGVG